MTCSNSIKCPCRTCRAATRLWLRAVSLYLAARLVMKGNT